MIVAPIIFCAPEFKNRIETLCTESLVLPCSTDLKTCQAQITGLDRLDQKVAWILFQGNKQEGNNHTVKDHINLSHENPLIGPVELDRGPRFPDMSAVYEPQTESDLIVVLGDDVDLVKFTEPWAPVTAGVWEAIALKHRGYKIKGWLIADLEKWIRELSFLN
ncbi:MAG: hypothetical protein HQ508_08170 [Candidatus Marinimicrobia bacterium]|nr:hypothetical protein [Candidatus Neomarinimicrobiota bacterium]